jgi:hypothetical protein
VLPSADTAAMLFWALLVSGQINMRKVGGWQTLPQNPSINRLTSPPDSLTSKCRRSRHTISNTIRDGTQSVCENTQSVQLGDHRE